MLRRARIKALAAVPVRKKLPQDSVDSTDANDVADKEKKKENISNISETEQEVTKDIINIKKEDKERNTFEQKEQKEKDISSIDISKQKKQKVEDISSTNKLERETVQDVATVRKEIKIEQSKVSLKESVIVEKLDSQESCSLKPDSQESTSAQTKPNSQSPSTGFKSEKVTDQSVQKNILLPDVPTAIDIGKKHVTRIRNLD